MSSEFLILSRVEVESVVTLKNAIECVREAFLAMSRGEAHLFPVLRERIEPSGGFFGVKAGYLQSQGVLGYKGGGFWAGNAAKSIAGHQSVILLYDPETGIPLSAMDGNYLTIIRTGAVGAIAARELARPDSKCAAIIGCGAQGEIQATALREVLPLEEVRCYDANRDSRTRLAAKLRQAGLDANEFPTAAEAVKGADIVVTCTPSFAPIVKEEWVREGTHFNAFGADTKGKQELETGIVNRAKVVSDYWPQSRTIGECQHAYSGGTMTEPHAELGDVLAGKRRGRETAREITMFDATGIALQDLAVAHLAYQTALSRGIGTRIRLD